MSRKVNTAPDGLKRVKRSASKSVAQGPDRQSALTSDSTTSETEKLLDIDGLLEIARLMEAVKKDGRLKSGGKKREGRSDTPRKSRRADQ